MTNEQVNATPKENKGGSSSKNLQVVEGNPEEGAKWESEFRANNTLPIEVIEKHIEAVKKWGLGSCGYDPGKGLTNLHIYFPYGKPEGDQQT